MFSDTGRNDHCLSQATVNSSGTSISCAFGLNGAQTGSYDVVVNNPDGSSFTKQGGFTVQSGGQPQIWADVVGRPKIRVGTPSTSYITIGNSGSVDAYFVLAWLSFPTGLNYSFPDRPDLGAMGSVPDPTTGLTSTLLVLPVIRAGQTISIPVSFTSTSAQATLPITILWRPPWFDSLQQAMSELNAAQQNPASLPASCQSVNDKPYLDDCLGYWTNVGVSDLSSTLTTPKTIVQIGPDVVSLFSSYLTTALANPKSRSTTYSSLSETTVVRPRPDDGTNSGFLGGWFDGIADVLNIPIAGDKRREQQEEPPPFQCTGATVTANCANPDQYVTCNINWGQYAVCTYTADAGILQNCNNFVTAYCADIRNNTNRPVTKPQNFSCTAGGVPSSRNHFQIGKRRLRQTAQQPPPPSALPPMYPQRQRPGCHANHSPLCKAARPRWPFLRSALSEFSKNGSR